jgi:UDP-N-acetylmuramoyl-tripeptide--D-alanyl-D-alanine ligase
MNYSPKGIKKIYHQVKRLLAKNWLKIWQPTQITITGSQGKTNTTQILAKILTKIASTVVTDVNLDTTFNVPITALKVTPWTKFAVFELGVDHVGEMDKHLKIVTPHIAVITGISPVHTDKEHFGSIENLIAEKRKLIEKLTPNDFAILNYNDENVKKMAPFTKAKVIFYGSDKKNCQFYFDKNSIKVTLSGTQFKLFSSDFNLLQPVLTGSNRFQPISTDFNQFQLISTKLIGFHHPSNLTAVYAVLKTLFPKNKNINSIFSTIVSKIEPLRGRMNIEKGPMKTILLNDSLRANPKSTDEGLKTFYKIDYKKGKKIAVLGVMGELYDPIKEHKKTAQTLISFPPDVVVGVGNYRKYTIDELIKLGFPKEKIFFAKDVFEAAEILKRIIKPGDFLYLKSSLLRNLWRIIKILNGEKICCQQEFCPYSHCKF